MDLYIKGTTPCEEYLSWHQYTTPTKNTKKLKQYTHWANEKIGIQPQQATLE